MPIKTFLLGKDSAIEDSINNFQQILSNANFTIIEHSWTNPANHVWVVQINDKDCPLLFTNGKGPSKKAALASALGKFVENLSTHYFWLNWYFGDELANNKFVHYSQEVWFKTLPNGLWPDGVLNESLQAFYNPDSELNASTLIDTNSGDKERGICCLPLECIRTGEMVNFPINIVNNLYARNGLSSGNNTTEARVHALSEILKNFVKFKVIAEGLSLPTIPKQILNRYPSIALSIKEVKSAGYELIIQDASLGGQYPVVVMTLLNPENQGIYNSFAAHPNFQIALERSLTNLLINCKLDKSDDFPQASFDMDEVASPTNLEAHYKNTNGIVAWKFLNDKTNYEFIDWDTKESNTNNIQNFQNLCDIIHRDGNDIFITEHNEIGANTCRILVPGISDIYPADNLVWENNNAGSDVREQILKVNKTEAEIEKLIEDLEDLNQDDHYLVSDLIGIPSDSDSIFSDLCVAELITLLALKIQDNERIQEGCEWLLDYENINPSRLITYQCINTILQLNGMTNYGNALEKLYTKALLNNALALIDGEDIYPLTSDWKTHKELIAAYKKVIKY